MKNLIKNYFIYILIILLSLISFIGAIVYRIYSLNSIGVILTIILSFMFWGVYIYKSKSKNALERYINTENNEKSKIFFSKFLILDSFYVLALISCFYILYSSITTASINSPWNVIPSYFFLLYFLAAALLILIVFYRKKNLILHISLFYFLSFSIAAVIYKIGFGFDPFVHKATLDIIKEQGFVTPKTLYYIGQYSLIIILNKITFIPIFYLDKFLVPFLAAITIPSSLILLCSKLFQNKKICFLSITSLLIIPYSIFIITTPQNLAFLFLFITIVYGLICKDLKDLIVVYLFSLTTIFIHPIAGIPALMFAVALSIYHSDTKKIKKYLFIIIFILSSITLPLAFLYTESHNLSPVQDSTEKTFLNIDFSNTITLIADNLKMNIPFKENIILNFIYLHGFNIYLIIGILIIFGIIIAYKNKKNCKIFFILLLISMSQIVSYFFIKQLPFNYLIDYERENFTFRILNSALIFLIPFILISIYWMLDKILKQNKLIKIILLAFILILITMNLYLSYPRSDNYYNFKGYSVSQNDFDVVNWIEENSSEDYIVLANQQVGAAALKTFGFSRYYKGDIYFYPMPTSCPLYQYYLKMVYEKPTKKTMQEAMDFAGVNEGYFVLNKYWWAFDKILEEAKLESDSWSEHTDGDILVFKYMR